MSALPIQLVEVDETLGPDGDPRGWLAQRARLAPEMPEPMAAVVLRCPEGLFAVEQGLALEALGAVEHALWDQVDEVRWIGAVGTSVLTREGRPLLVRWARLRFADGRRWAATWLRVPGLDLGPTPDELWTGAPEETPPWLSPLFDPSAEGLPPIAVVPVDGPHWRSHPELPVAEFVQELPENVQFEDVIQLAAARLERRFTETGLAPPTLVAWVEDELIGWSVEGETGARRLNRLGRAMARDGSVVALGLFGVGQDALEEGGQRPMIALAMEHREAGSVLWLRRFEHTGENAARWVDPTGLLRVPGPPLHWFDR